MPAGQPFVSIVVPTYNYGHFIAETLESLNAQTHANWECIVVDDGSTDDTETVLEQFATDARIRYLRRSNGKQGAAKNAGLRVSNGAYVQFLDADDLLEPAKLERHVAYLERNPDADIVYGDVRYFDVTPNRGLRYSMGPANEPWMPRVSGTGKRLLAELIRANVMVLNSALLRSSVVEDVGYFDESLPPVEDWDYWVRSASAGKRFAYHDPAGTHALVRTHPASSSKNLRRLAEAELELRRKVAASLDDPELQEANQALLQGLEDWLERVETIRSELRSALPAARSFICVDNEELRAALGLPQEAVPFLERDGVYDGAPADDRQAIAELERLRDEGAAAIAFAWPAFWWLEYYESFAKYLRSRFPCVVESEHLVLFDLRREAGL